MTYPLPSWTDDPTTSDPIDAENLDLYNTAIDDLDSRTSTIEASGAVNALATAKGDMIAAHGVNDMETLAVGTNGQVLTAASSATLGVHWADPAPGGVSSVTAADTTIHVDNTDPINPTVKVNPGNLTIAESQVTSLTTDLAGKQGLNSNLTTIGGLTPGAGNVMAADGSGWISKTYAALKTALGLVKADVGLSNVDNTSDATKNSAVATLTNKTLTSPVINTPTGIVASDVGAQPVDSDLTAIAALTPSNDDIVQRKAGAWTNRTMAQLSSDLGLAANYQPLDSDLTALAALTPTNDDIVQRKAGAWVNRSIAQLSTDLALSTTYQPLDSDLTTIAALTPGSGNVLAADGGGWISKTYASLKTALVLVKADVGLSNVDNTSDATKNSATATLTGKTLTSPVINSPTGIVKGDVGLGNVDNTSDATKNSATATLTNKTLTSPVINSPTGIVASDVGAQPLDGDLTAIAALTQTSGYVITSNGTTWTAAAPTASWSTFVETLADGSTLSPDCQNGLIRVGSCSSLSQNTTLNAPANGSVGATYRAQITAFSGNWVVTFSGWLGTTDNATSSITVPTGKTASILGEYCAAGWMYGGYTLQA
jgi:hypothetical protein